MNDQQIAEKWNNLSIEQRTAVIKTDKSMRDPRWKALVERMTARWDQLTQLQKEAILANPYRTHVENLNARNKS